MKFWLSSIVFLSLLMCSQMVHAQGTVIYQDDFEGTVTGWSNNTTDFDPDVTRFLGRFANNPTSTSQTFTIPANTDQVVIEFDLYRFDSWIMAHNMVLIVSRLRLIIMRFFHYPSPIRKPPVQGRPRMLIGLTPR